MKILKKEMRELSMTSQDLAFKLDVSGATITHWLKGRNLPTILHMIKLNELGFSKKAQVNPSSEV